MPKTKQLPEVRTRLRTDDQIRLDSICRAEGKTQAEIVRQALLFYLDAVEVGQTDKRETKLEKRLKAMEDRLAGLQMKTSTELALMQMRTAIDVGLIYEALYFNFGKEAEKAFPAFHKHAINRLKRKRDDQEDRITISQLISSLYKRDEN